jgi:hypothetical protein
MPKLSATHVLPQPSLFETAPQHPRWEDLPREVRRQVIDLLSNLLLSGGIQSSLAGETEGGNDE